MPPLLGDVSSLVASGSFSAASNMLGVSQVHCPALTPLFLTTAALAEFPGNTEIKRAALMKALQSDRAGRLMSGAISAGVSQNASEYVAPSDPLARIADEFGRWDDADVRMSLSALIHGGRMWDLFLAMGKRYDLGPDIYFYLEATHEELELNRSRFRDRHEEDIASLEKGPPFSTEMTTRLARGFEGPMTTEGVLYYMREKLLAPPVDVPDCPAFTALLIFARNAYLKLRLNPFIDRASLNELAKRTRGTLIRDLTLTADFAVHAGISFEVFISPTYIRLVHKDTSLDFEPVGLMSLGRQAEHDRRIGIIGEDQKPAPLEALIASFLVAIGCRVASDTLIWSKDLFRLALKIYPQHPNALLHLATLEKDDEEAERLLLKAHELNPKRVRVLETLGDFYRRRCHVESARHFFRRAIQTARDHIDLMRREHEGRSNDGGIVRIFNAIDYGDFLETASETDSPEEMFEQFRSRIESKMP